MWEKFGEFDSYEEINRAAAAQLKEDDIEAIYAIAEENGIDREDAEEFIEGDAAELVTALMAAIGKLKVEAAELKPKEIMTDWVNYIQIQCVEDPKMRLAVRRRGKHLHFQHQNSVLFPVTVQILKVPLLLQPPLKSGHLHPGQQGADFHGWSRKKGLPAGEPWQCAFSVPPASCCDSLCRPCKYVRLPRHKNALKEKQWWIFHSRKVQLKRQQNLWGL